MAKKHTQLKNTRREIANMFFKYRTYKFKLQYATSFVNEIKSFNKNELEEYRNYTKMIDSVLNYMNRENSSILADLHIRTKDYRELGYSTTTFYKKYKEAISEFLGYLK
jgi:hypothetical protein